MFLTLSIASGLLVGLALGLTGGGGAVFAVPLLVYGLAVGPREAGGVSLAAVGCTAAAGCLHRVRTGDVETRVGLLFALCGMVGAPAGTWAATLLPDALLLALFAALMVVVALRMVFASNGISPGRAASVCGRGPNGTIVRGGRCVALLAGLGFLTGGLSGLFGIGGGFLIVPGLVLLMGMAVRRAIGTSLLVITLVSISGVASHLARGRSLPLDVTLLFAVGGLGGMVLGSTLARRLSAVHLQKVFAGAILVVAVFVVVKSIV
jgi:uncharacterized membrane protein YfcA